MLLLPSMLALVSVLIPLSSGQGSNSLGATLSFLRDVGRDILESSEFHFATFHLKEKEKFPTSDFFFLSLLIFWEFHLRVSFLMIIMLTLITLAILCL